MKTRRAISVGVPLSATFSASCGVGAGDPTRRRREPGVTPASDARDVRCGPHERNALELWKAASDRLTPLAAHIINPDKIADRSSHDPRCIEKYTSARTAAHRNTKAGR